MTDKEGFWTELAQIQAESIGWLPLDKCPNLQVASDGPIIQVVGITQAAMAVSNVPWLT